MKVLLTHLAYQLPGGEDAVFENEIDLLQRGGVEVIPWRRSNMEINAHGLGNKIGAALATIWSREAASALAGLIREHRPDVVHFHNTFPLLSPSVYWAAGRLGVPVVQTVHNFRLVCPGALLYRDGAVCERCLDGSVLSAVRFGCYRGSRSATSAAVAMLLFHRALGTYRKQVTRYIALTKFAANRLRIGGIPAERLCIKPNFLTDPPQPRFGVGNYVLFAGRLSKEKGLQTLLSAWGRGGSDFPLLKIAGDGPQRGELMQFSQSNRLNVEFVGHLDHAALIEAISGSSFMVIPSEWYEGFPMAILEAYACGKPVLAARIGSLDELVVDGQTGRKFSAGDPTSLADVLTDMLASQSALEDMGRRARALFEANYTAEANLTRLLEIYGEAISQFNAGMQ